MTTTLRIFAAELIWLAISPVIGAAQTPPGPVLRLQSARDRTAEGERDTLSSGGYRASIVYRDASRRAKCTSTACSTALAIRSRPSRLSRKAASCMFEI